MSTSISFSPTPDVSGLPKSEQANLNRGGGAASLKIREEDHTVSHDSKFLYTDWFRTKDDYESMNSYLFIAEPPPPCTLQGHTEWKSCVID